MTDRLRLRTHARFRDVVLFALIATTSWLIGWHYPAAFRSSGGEAGFYQIEFGPAVMVACGRPFENPDLRHAPELESFLQRKTRAFVCADLPKAVPTKPLNSLQAGSRYLFGAVAGVWRGVGIRWEALDLVSALLFSAAVTCLYTAVRIAVGPWPAFLVAAIWMTSPMHLGNLPHLRDYAKAPFFAAMLLACAAAVRVVNPSRLPVIGVVFGALQGIGFGMRTDVLLNLPPFLMAVVAGRSDGLSHALRAKLACATLTVAAFAVVALPILRVYSTQSALWHLALLGLTTPFDAPLNVRPATYELGYVYDDSYVSTVVHAYWNRTHEGRPAIPFGTAAYGAACAAYYGAIARVFPGDLTTRAVGSVLRVLDLPFSITYGRVPAGVTHPLLTWLAERRAAFLLALRGAGPMAALLVVFTVAAQVPRQGAVLCLLIVNFAAYPFLQFQIRHVFHLEWLSVALLVTGLAFLWRMIRSSPRLVDNTARLGWMRAGARGAMVVAMCLTAVGITLVIARAVQRPRVQALLSSYESAATETIITKEEPLGDGRTLLRADLFDRTADGDRVQAEMLSVRIDRRTCTAAKSALTVRYGRLAHDSPDLSWARAVPRGIVSVFLPAYAVDYQGQRQFEFLGLEVATELAPCVRVRKFADPRSFPLLLDAVRSSEWESATLTQRVYLGSALPERVWLLLTRGWPSIATLG